MRRKSPPAFIRGVVEGFYGVYYTFPERIDLIRFIGRHNYNLYLYAPKNDRQKRARWQEPYPRQIMAQFAETVKAARQAGVQFCYGISPGGSICYSDPQDFNKVIEKLLAFFHIGVRAFSLMLDDNEPGFRFPADARRYASPSEAQASLANRLYAWLRSLDPSCTLILVPGDYYGRAPFSKGLIGLASRLHPDIDLCYTGPEICSKEIKAEDARAFAKATGRKPLIWDNYPVNDLAMQSELHIEPVTGRDAALTGEVKGFLVNPMNQAEASKIVLLTFATYWANPYRYEPGAAWRTALRAVAGEDYAPALRVLAENVRYHRPDQKLDCLAESALRSLRSGIAARQKEAARPGSKSGRDSSTILGKFVARQDAPRRSLLDSPEVRELEDYLTEIDEAGYALKFRLENLALRNNLLPWIEVLEHWMWMTRFGLRALRAIEAGTPYVKDLSRVYEYRTAIQTHSKRIACQALDGIINFILEQVVLDQRRRIQSVTIAGRLS